MLLSGSRGEMRVNIGYEIFLVFFVYFVAHVLARYDVQQLSAGRKLTFNVQGVRATII